MALKSYSGITRFSPVSLSFMIKKQKRRDTITNYPILRQCDHSCYYRNLNQGGFNMRFFGKITYTEDFLMEVKQSAHGISGKNRVYMKNTVMAVYVEYGATWDNPPANKYVSPADTQILKMIEDLKADQDFISADMLRSVNTEVVKEEYHRDFAYPPEATKKHFSCC